MSSGNGWQPRDSARHPLKPGAIENSRKGPKTREVSRTADRAKFGPNTIKSMICSQINPWLRACLESGKEETPGHALQATRFSFHHHRGTRRINRLCADRGFENRHPRLRWMGIWQDRRSQVRPG